MLFARGFILPFLLLIFAATTSNAFTLSPSPSLTSQMKYTSTLNGLSSSTHTSTFKHSSSSSRHSTSALNLSVGIVGATGAVGKEILSVMEKRNFPASQLRLFGTPRSAGRIVPSPTFGSIDVELFDDKKAKECDIVFLAVSGEFALEHAESIAASGTCVIDNSSAFRMNPKVPLVVPEINGKVTKTKRLIANPNCTTAIGVMALWPLHLLFGIKKIIMSTYQASSGAGQEGMDELFNGTRQIVTGEKKVADNKVFAQPLPFNLIPHIDSFTDNGYTKEEMKVTHETRKICGLPFDLPISCTAVRIPILRAHSEAIVIETERPVDIELAMKTLAVAPGVKLVDDIHAKPPRYPMPLTATGQDDVEVGRLRKSQVFGEYGMEFFVSGDQLLRGAALNAVLIAEYMLKEGEFEGNGKLND